MNYSEMSDVELAVLVGKHISRDGQALVGITGKACIHEYVPPFGGFGEMCLGWREFDPCNSWDEAGPIVIENKIAIIPDSAAGEWLAFNDFTLYEGDWMFAIDPERHANDSNPLRAAMIVFLMMKEAK